LDSLVRIEAYQWVTRDKPQIFFARLLPGVSRAARAASGFSRGKYKIAHEANLSYFLIFCN
jgi:hypothetical protein